MSAAAQKRIDEHLEWLRQLSQSKAQSTPPALAAARQVRRAANEPQVHAEKLPAGMFLASEVGGRGGYTPPLEIVEGLLTAGSTSMIFGQSNSGKTFLALDLGCAVARGEPWMGRRVNGGLVVYVAAESVGSVRGRLHAYQQHHGIALSNLIVVQHPLNLMSDHEVEELVENIRKAEEQAGAKCQLIVGDTLARMTVGAKENAVEDMGVVIANSDRIRRATGAHVCLIHHSGKDADKGARGHSSLRAAVDTEIEVAAVLDEEGELVGRRARVTKQRDLRGGDEINFDLEVVEIGISQWGCPVTSCVVVGGGLAPAVAPAKTPPKQAPDEHQKAKGGRLRRPPVKKISLEEEGWEPVNQHGFNPEEWRLPTVKQAESQSQGWESITKPDQRVKP